MQLNCYCLSRFGKVYICTTTTGKVECFNPSFMTFNQKNFYFLELFKMLHNFSVYPELQKYASVSMVGN